MLQRFSRSFKSSLVKAEASSVLNNTVAPAGSNFQLSVYSTQALKEYFDQNGIMFPLETLIEKCQEKDYDFFLTQQNFYKVADTLEKFESFLDLNSPESKEFILFKRQLYEVYEVTNRSTLEHSLYTGEIDDISIHRMKDASLRHLQEMRREYRIERLTAHMNLKGKFYQRKWMSVPKVQGIASILASTYVYINLPYLAPTFGVNLPWTASMVGFIYGGLKFNEFKTVDSLEVVAEGEHQGKVKLAYTTSPFTTSDIYCNVEDIERIQGYQDCPDHAVIVHSGIDGEGNHFGEPMTFRLAKDAWIDAEGFDWILSKSEGTETDSLFTDLLQERANKLASGASMKSINDIDSHWGETQQNQLPHNKDWIQSSHLETLRAKYGYDHLNSLSDQQFYELYRSHVAQ